MNLKEILSRTDGTVYGTTGIHDRWRQEMISNAMEWGLWARTCHHSAVQSLNYSYNLSHFSPRGFDQNMVVLKAAKFTVNFDLSNATILEKSFRTEIKWIPWTL